MKSVTPLALFAVVAVAATIPNESGWYVRRADEMPNEDLPIVDLQVTDERFGDKVFTGTAESIYNQMKAEKPELFANETEISVEESSLEKRQGSFNCNWYGNLDDRVGQWWFCHEGTAYLDRLGTAWCGVNAAPACARVSCSTTCGMFLCNKQNSHLQVHCRDIATDIRAIANACINTNLGAVSGARDFASHFIGLRKQNC